jgi:hypothetical protein
VVLDADNNKVETPFQDLESLPLDVVSMFTFIYHIHFITATSPIMIHKVALDLFSYDLLLCTSYVLSSSGFIS